MSRRTKVQWHEDSERRSKMERYRYNKYEVNTPLLAAEPGERARYRCDRATCGFTFRAAIGSVKICPKCKAGGVSRIGVSSA